VGALAARSAAVPLAARAESLAAYAAAAARATPEPQRMTRA
jgi:hypothetical protein